MTLITMSPTPILLTLGAFTMFFGFRNIFGLTPRSSCRALAVPAGLLGGTTGALFARADAVHHVPDAPPLDKGQVRATFSCCSESMALPPPGVPVRGPAARLEAADRLRPGASSHGGGLYIGQGAPRHHERGHAAGGRSAARGERRDAVPEAAI